MDLTAIQEILPSADRIVASDNFTAWVLLFAVALLLRVFVMSRSRQFSDETLHWIEGGIWLCSGWGFHRIYWWVWRLLRDAGECGSSTPHISVCDKARVFVDLGWITTAFFMMVFYGCYRLVTPFGQELLRHYWRPFAFAAIVSLWATGFFISWAGQAIIAMLL
jgi:hypothetical protein